MRKNTKSLVQQIKRKKEFANAHKSRNPLLRSIVRVLYGGGETCKNMIACRVEMFHILRDYLVSMYIKEEHLDKKEIPVFKDNVKVLTISSDKLGEGVETGPTGVRVATGMGPNERTLRLACKYAIWCDSCFDYERIVTELVASYVCPNFPMLISQVPYKHGFLRFYEVADTTLAEFLVSKKYDEYTLGSIVAQNALAVLTFHYIVNKSHNDAHEMNILLMKTDDASRESYWHYKITYYDIIFSMNGMTKSRKELDVYVKNCGWLALLTDFGRAVEYTPESGNWDYKCICQGQLISAAFKRFKVDSTKFLQGSELNSKSKAFTCLRNISEMINGCVLFEKKEGMTVIGPVFNIEFPA